MRFEHKDGRKCVRDWDGRWRHWDYGGEQPGPADKTPETICNRYHNEPADGRRVFPEAEDRGMFGMPGVGHLDIPKLTIAPDTFIRVVGRPGTELAARIITTHLPQALGHFLERNAEYGDDDDFNLGVAGQYVDISRKVQKLKRRWWDGEDAPDGSESDKVIVMELIGHLLMAMDMMAQGEEEDGDGAR